LKGSPWNVSRLPAWPQRLAILRRCFLVRKIGLSVVSEFFTLLTRKVIVAPRARCLVRAMARKLKVYRTATGFYDSYVAAPSQKAALEAWGIDRNLFAMEMADVVTDPDLTEEPLSKPGIVVRRPRGTPEEQIAALPRDRNGRPKPKVNVRRRPARKTPPKPKPKPSRSRLDAAEAALSKAEVSHKAELKALADEAADLARRRRAAAKRQHDEINRLERDRDRAEAAYRVALGKWPG
jgi:hypothetical protein